MLGKGKQLLLSIVDTAPDVSHDAINHIFFARQKSFHLSTAIVRNRAQMRSHDSETRNSPPIYGVMRFLETPLED